MADVPNYFYADDLHMIKTSNTTYSASGNITDSNLNKHPITRAVISSTSITIYYIDSTVENGMTIDSTTINSMTNGNTINY